MIEGSRKTSKVFPRTKLQAAFQFRLQKACLHDTCLITPFLLWTREFKCRMKPFWYIVVWNSIQFFLRLMLKSCSNRNTAKVHITDHQIPAKQPRCQEGARTPCKRMTQKLANILHHQAEICLQIAQGSLTDLLPSSPLQNNSMGKASSRLRFAWRNSHLSYCNRGKIANCLFTYRLFS